uniref:Uncharacterized protein n=1 Tax=Sipha flava TaxID=143950 RepID=A0A2S2Q3Y6_9HEMI
MTIRFRDYPSGCCRCARCKLIIDMVVGRLGYSGTSLRCHVSGITRVVDEQFTSFGVKVPVRGKRRGLSYTNNTLGPVKQCYGTSYDSAEYHEKSKTKENSHWIPAVNDRDVVIPAPLHNGKKRSSHSSRFIIIYLFGKVGKVQITNLQSVIRQRNYLET